MRAGVAAIGAALLLTLPSGPVHAGYLVTLTEDENGNLVASGSGFIDFTGLTYQISFAQPPSLAATGAIVVTGPPNLGAVTDVYNGFANKGPANFGNAPRRSCLSR